MKFNPKERGQSVVVVALILVFIAVFGYLAISTMGSKGYQDGADVIGETVGDAIDSVATQPDVITNNPAADPELENLLTELSGAVSTWANSQKMYPNQHAIEEHGDDAWKTTDCYNRNGYFHAVKTTKDGIHLLCQDDDGSVRDMILTQRGNSNKFDFKTAFTPKDGTLREVMKFVNGKLGAGKFTMPDNAIIYIDDVIAP